MRHLYDLEQEILKCWNITDDIQILYEKIVDKDSNKDEICNFLLGLKTIYNMKFEKTFAVFEKTLEEEFDRKNKSALFEKDSIV